MKIKLLLILLIPIILSAQNVDYKFKGPIETLYGIMSGNDDDGYALTSGNAIYSIDPYNNYKINKIKSYKIDAKAYIYSKGTYELNGVSYQFYTDKNNLNYKKIEKDGSTGDGAVFINGDDIDLKGISYSVYKNNNQLIVELVSYNDRTSFIDIKFQPKIYYRIFDENLNLISKCGTQVKEALHSFWIDDLYYNPKDKKVYGRFYKGLKEKDENYDYNHFGTMVISNEKDIAFIKDKNQEYKSGLLFNHLGENNLIGLGFNEKENSIFTFSNRFNEKIEELDKKNVLFSIHPNFKDRTVENKIKFNYKFIDKELLPDGSIVTCYMLKVDMGSSIHNLLFTKYDKNGDILFNTTVPIAGLNYYSTNYKFSITEKQINLVYVDFLDNVTLGDGVKYNGKYAMALTIDAEGEKSSQVLFNAEKYEKTNIYHVFKNTFNLNPNTFITFVYKKKKEDYIVEVSFKD